MLDSVLALLFVFALLAGCLWLLRQWGSKQAGGGNLAVVETLAIGPNKTLSLVRVGPRLFLLAATNERVSLVSELNPDELADCPAPETKASLLSGLLSNRLRRPSEGISEPS